MVFAVSCSKKPAATAAGGAASSGAKTAAAAPAKKGPQIKDISASQTNIPKKDGKILVRYWYPWGGDSEKWDKTRMANFDQDNPGYIIDSTYVPEGAGVRNGKLLAAINAGDVPDVCVSDAPTQTYSLACQGAFEPIDAALKAVGFDPKRAAPGLLPYMKWKGVSYIYPQNTDVVLLFYRTDFFKAAGLNPDNPPKSIDELDADAAKLTVKDAKGNTTRYGFIPWLDAGQDPSTWTFQFGADVYDEATDKITIATPQCAKVYEWERGYAKRGDPARMKSFTSSLGAAFSPNHAFMVGKVAMTVIGNWFCNALRIHDPKLKYGDNGYKVAPMPTLTPDIYGSCAFAGNLFFSPMGAKNILGGVKFMDYCQQAKEVEDNNKYWRSLGIYKDQIEQLSLYKAKDPALQVCIAVTFNPHSSAWALSPVTSQLDDQLRSFSDKAIYSDVDIPSGLKQIQDQLQPTVDKIVNGQ
jgi:multiple sugar transport system substrate-binding protein